MDRIFSECMSGHKAQSKSGVQAPNASFRRLIFHIPDLHIDERRFIVLPFVNFLNPVVQRHRDMIRCVIGINDCAVSTATDELDWKCFGHV